MLHGSKCVNFVYSVRGTLFSLNSHPQLRWPKPSIRIYDPPGLFNNDTNPVWMVMPAEMHRKVKCSRQGDYRQTQTSCSKVTEFIYAERCVNCERL